MRREHSYRSSPSSFIASAGFDHQVKIFTAGDWSPVQTLSAHTGPVASCDVSRDGKWIVSGGNDRTIKLWGVGMILRASMAHRTSDPNDKQSPKPRDSKIWG